MPRIFDNIDKSLLPALRDTLGLSTRSDFCVGYFNLRGWKTIDEFIEEWSGGPDHSCRLLVGMQRLPQEDLHLALSLLKTDAGIDNQTATRLKKNLAEEFRQQLMFGAPTNQDEIGLRRLAAQIRSKKAFHSMEGCFLIRSAISSSDVSNEGSISPWSRSRSRNSNSLSEKGRIILKKSRHS